MLQEHTKQQVLELLSSALFQKEITLTESTDWLEIFEEMKSQAVVGIPCDLVVLAPTVDERLKRQWLDTTVKQVGFVMQLMQAQQELVNLMESEEIPMVILKGAAAAVYYPQPDYRTMGDVDFLVKEQYFKAALDILLSHGYQNVYAKESNFHYHRTLEKDGITFEMHKRPAGIADGPAGKYVMEVITKGMHYAKKIQWESWSFHVLPELQNGLVLLLHIVSHLKNGLGLRQILDWMMFVAREVDDRAWKEEYQPVLKQAGLENLALVITRMCQRYLGLSEENITWCLNADEELGIELMDYLITQGNFGSKMKEHDKGVKFFSSNKSLRSLWKSLQCGGCWTWKALDKYPWLSCFAWAYQIYKYTGRLLTGRYTFHSLRSDILESREKDKMFGKLVDK